MRTLSAGRAGIRIPALLVAFAALFAGWIVLATPLSAQAHDSLVSSDPPARGTVETLPDSVTLTFSAALIGGEGTTAVQVTDAAGESVTDGEPELDGATVTQPLTGEGPAGVYTVVWQVVSSDGHPTFGEFTFTVATGTDAGGAGAEQTATPAPEPSASATPTATPDDAATLAPEAPSSDEAPVWPWIVGAAGILIVIGITWWLLRGRRAGSSDATER